MEEVKIQRGGPRGKKESNRKRQRLPYEDVVPGKKILNSKIMLRVNRELVFLRGNSK